MDRGASDVGIVSIGRNEGERFVACLESIDVSTYDTVYVDSGSTDGSCEEAARRGIEVVNLNLTMPFTAARARNAGFAVLKARNPGIAFVQFVDGDCALDPGWLSAARDFLISRPDVAGVCGRRRERHPTASVYNALTDLEWNTPVGEASAVGGDAMMRADAFASVGGFRTQLIAGEEPELCLRLREKGWKIWRLDAEMTLHDAAMMRFSQWWARAVRCGYGYAEVAWLHRNSKFAIWKVNVLRAVLWGGAIPLIIAAASIANVFVALGVMIYVLQILRIAVRHGFRERLTWIFAALMTAAKPAEFLGIVRFVWRRAFGRAAKIIEYK